MCKKFSPVLIAKILRKEIEITVIEKASQGDAAAFGEIYFTLRDPIYGFVYRMLREISAAEDITQEVFMFLLENPKKYSSERGSLRAFLCGVARNKTIRYLQRRGTKLELIREETDDLDESPDFLSRSPLDYVLDKELFVQVEECLARLPILQREALILREMEELSCEEIARVTGAEIGAVKVRLHRARKNLAREIAPYLSVKKKEMSYEMR